ncbi:flagellar motor switch protein FliM [Ruicaihuangia caeni]|uniref:Flagellar motor switch protein FliM n=1 Tax=Ruicaihuangia caeni TaxID=3042517 RepID=A0AAW6T7Y6_9MICO|nr:flagellar motor switch protein FliM [Klugiella sp. YN-L-19]MDI2097893.1 flagellar motor switch protein FliM [Klugiella sp. YN-L-19]
MTVQEHVGGGVPASPLRSIELYDFRRPSTLAREHSRVLELAFETFARQWGTQLTSRVRAMAQVSCEQVIMTRYDDYAASLPPTTAMVLCTIEGHQSKAVVQFPTSAGLSWIGSMLGGTVTGAVPERQFTAVEQALLGKVMEQALEDLGYSLGALLPAALAVEKVHYNSQFAQAAPTAELMIVARFFIRVGENLAPATVAIPADTILPQLGGAAIAVNQAESHAALRSQLGEVPVTVGARFAPVTITPERVLSLAVGDVLRLPHPQHRPLRLAVDGEPLATAAVGRSGTRLACIVVTTEENTRVENPA